MIQQSVDLSLDSPIPLPLPAKKSRYLRNFAKGSLKQHFLIRCPLMYTPSFPLFPNNKEVDDE